MLGVHCIGQRGEFQGIAWTRFLCPDFYQSKRKAPGHKKRVQATVW